MKYLILLLTLFSMLKLTYGQELIKCKDTTYCIYNEDNFYFYVKLTGDIRETERNNVLQVNEYALNYSYYESELYTDDKDRIMNNYLKAEKEYFTNQLGHSIDIKTDTMYTDSLINGIFWYFEMPKEYQTLIKNMLFYSVIIEGKIFVLSSTQFTIMTFDEVEQFLVNTMSTLTLIKESFNKRSFCSGLK